MFSIMIRRSCTEETYKMYIEYLRMVEGGRESGREFNSQTWFRMLRIF